MQDTKSLILSFRADGYISDAELMPLLSHAVLEYISAREVHAFLRANDIKIAARRIRDLRKKAADWLGLTQHKPGRVSRADLELQHAKWHKKYGYPTLEDLVDGWKPGANSGGETRAKIESNSEAEIEEDTEGKTTPKKRSKTATPAPQKKRNNFSKLAAEIEPVKAGSATQSTDEILESIKRPIKETN